MPQVTFGFNPARRVEAKFDAPQISSDGGVLLLRQLDTKLGLSERFAKLLPDIRDARFVVHGREEQLRQRVLQIALGYEDQNDAAWLRDDPLWKTACDRLPDDEAGLSSQPTLSRFEHAVDARTVVGLQRAFEDDYVASLPAKTGIVVLDLDATDDPAHGQQPLAFFHAHYDARIYFPLLVFDGTGRLVSFRLRAGNAGNNKYATALMTRLIRKIKARFPRATVLVRADSGFCNPRLLDALDALHTELGEVATERNAEDRVCPIVAATRENKRGRGDNDMSRAGLFRDFLKLAGVSEPAFFVETATDLMIDFRSLRDSGITWRFLAGERAEVVQREAGHEHISTTLGYAKEVHDRRGRYGVPFPPLPATLLQATEVTAEATGDACKVSEILVGAEGFDSLLAKRATYTCKHLVFRGSVEQPT